MGLKTLHIFNPEHDLALGVGEGPYTPPAEVLKLRKKQSLLPALYAGHSDFILVRDKMPAEEISRLPYFTNIEDKNLTIVFPEDIHRLNNEVQKVLPWGWDHAVRSYLIKNGLSEKFLPDKEEIEAVRRLSHRRTSIPFREHIAALTGDSLINPAKELFSIPEVNEFLKSNPVAFFKAPWSSSGRGIVVSDHISEKGLMEWCHGIIKHQGSVIAEPAWEKIFDFATEWIIENKEVKFLGYAVFETSSRGKYHGNISGDRNVLRKIIEEKAPNFNEGILEAQYETIKNMIAPFYAGYLGIDLLADSEGNINSCVEINLRMTMGHVELMRGERNIG